MPELPEIETVCNGLRPFIEGQKLIAVKTMRPDLRRPFPPDFEQRLTGRTVTDIVRRAKYMIWRLDDGWALLIHLGMSGSLTVRERNDAPLGKHNHVLFDTESGMRAIYNDPRRFGVMDLAAWDNLDAHPSLAGLGPEPLGRQFGGATLYKATQRRHQPIKSALLDQKLVAGLGNIYVCEALFQAKIRPTRDTSSLSAKECEKLAAAIKDVLRLAIKAGGSTLKDHRQPSGELGYFQHSFAVYDHEGEPCPICHDLAGIKRIVQAGRSTYYCPVCQR